MQNDLPFFSVIIPTHNRENIIMNSVQSVLNQTFTDFELFVIDDGSTDKTCEIISAVAEQDKRVRYVWQENTGGPSGPRNTGIRMGAGKYCAFLDSDDVWHSSKLAEVYNEIIRDNEDTGFYYHDYSIVTKGEDFVKLTKSRDLHYPYFNDLLVNGNCIGVLTAVVKRDLLLKAGLFNTRKDYSGVGDYDLWLRLSRMTKCKYIRKILAELHIHGGNMSEQVERQFAEWYALLLDYIPELENKQAQNKAWSLFYYYFAVVKFRERSFKEAREFSLRSLSYDGANIKSYLFLMLSWIAPLSPDFFLWCAKLVRRRLKKI